MEILDKITAGEQLSESDYLWCAYNRVNTTSTEMIIMSAATIKWKYLQTSEMYKIIKNLAYRYPAAVQTLLFSYISAHIRIKYGKLYIHKMAPVCDDTLQNNIVEFSKLFISLTGTRCGVTTIIQVHQNIIDKMTGEMSSLATLADLNLQHNISLNAECIKLLKILGGE
jgi:hypothetical protein